MAITTPYSVELERNQQSIDVVEAAAATVVANKMKLFVGGNIEVWQRQAYVGSLKNCFNVLMNEVVRLPLAAPANRVVYGPGLSAKEINITIDTDPTSVGADDVAISVSSTRPGPGSFSRSGRPSGSPVIPSRSPIRWPRRWPCSRTVTSMAP